LSSLILAYFYFLYFRRTWGIFLPVIYCLSALIGFVAINIDSARFLVETSYGLLGVGWLVSIVHGGLWYVRSGKKVEA
jgi:Na+-translocating ferredoxin:NAD+ oxidoreductase RnfA subunit